MSEAVSALGGAFYKGFVTIEETGPCGMITLRGDLGSEKMRAALHKATGLDMPGQRGIALNGERGLAWMSPDEALLMLPYAEAPATVAQLEKALAGEFALAVDVSDARAVFRIRGAGAREVLAKLCPVDLAPEAFGPGEIRRTRAAQVAAAIWISGDEEFSLVCFRSVAAYVWSLLTTAARPGSEVGIF